MNSNSCVLLLWHNVLSVRFCEIMNVRHVAQCWPHFSNASGSHHHDHPHFSSEDFLLLFCFSLLFKSRGNKYGAHTDWEKTYFAGWHSLPVGRSNYIRETLRHQTRGGWSAWRHYGCHIDTDRQSSVTLTTANYHDFLESRGTVVIWMFLLKRYWFTECMNNGARFPQT